MTLLVLNGGAVNECARLLCMERTWQTAPIMIDTETKSTDSIRVVGVIQKTLMEILETVRRQNPSDPCDLRMGDQRMPQPNDRMPQGTSVQIVFSFGRPDDFGLLSDIVIWCERGPGRNIAEYKWRASNGEDGQFDVEATDTNLRKIEQTLRDLADRVIGR